MYMSPLVDSVGPGKVIPNSVYTELQFTHKEPVSFVFCFLFSFFRVGGEKKKEMDLQLPAN